MSQMSTPKTVPMKEETVPLHNAKHMYFQTLYTADHIYSQIEKNSNMFLQNVLVKPIRFCLHIVLEISTPMIKK